MIAVTRCQYYKFINSLLVPFANEEIVLYGNGNTQNTVYLIKIITMNVESKKVSGDDGLDAQKQNVEAKEKCVSLFLFTSNYSDKYTY